MAREENDPEHTLFKITAKPDILLREKSIAFNDLIDKIRKETNEDPFWSYDGIGWYEWFIAMTISYMQHSEINPRSLDNSFECMNQEAERISDLLLKALATAVLTGMNLQDILYSYSQKALELDNIEGALEDDLVFKILEKLRT